MEVSLLHCPIRGRLRVRQRAADGLTFTEEKHRIDAIKYLLQRNYPKDNFGVESVLFHIGRDGKNSFRTDFAIYDEPWDNIRGKPLARRIESIKVLAEVKRDNFSAELAKATQVKAALQLVPDMETLGVYWDDVEQRFFYRKISGSKSTVLDAPINKMPDWGDAVSSTQLVYSDLRPTRDLVRVFDEIEQSLHPHIVDKVERYTIIQQLLLSKIHDENTAAQSKNKSHALSVQDFSIEPISDTEVAERMNSALSEAAKHYNVYLPKGKKVESAFRCPAEALRNASRSLAPINVLRSKSQVIQTFI